MNNKKVQDKANKDWVVLDVPSVSDASEFKRS